MSDEGFLSRWARRKEQVRSGEAVSPTPERPTQEPVREAVREPLVASAPNVEVRGEPALAEPLAPEPLPTLADVALLTRESDYSRFVASGVDEGVKRAAMKKLFQDPHFNIMDGLDTYIDDYGKPDPIPLSMLKQMNQSKFLRLFDDEDEQGDRKEGNAEEGSPTCPDTLTASTEPLDDDPDLQLQPDDAAGQPGLGQGPRA
jgi:hypothetical protein